MTTQKAIGIIGVAIPTIIGIQVAKITMKEFKKLTTYKMPKKRRKRR